MDFPGPQDGCRPLLHATNAKGPDYLFSFSRLVRSSVTHPKNPRKILNAHARDLSPVYKLNEFSLLNFSIS